MKVVFFGTSAFAANVLEFLVKKNIDICAIVTRIDKPKGRRLEMAYPPVKQRALEVCPQIPLYQPIKASTPEFEEILRSFNPDLFVVVAYGEIIKQHILSVPKKGCINIHASLLPHYRGAAPMQRCLMDGVSQTGISIIEMTPQMDAGDVLAIGSVPVSLETTLGDLEPQLCCLGCDLVLQTIHEIDSGIVRRTPQKHELATLASKITAEEERIDWKKPAHQLHNLIRALSPSPGAWCLVRIGSQEKRLKIKRSLIKLDIHAAPGTVIQFSQEGCIVACGEGALSLLELQLEGKKNLSFSDFVRGIHLPIQFL